MSSSTTTSSGETTKLVITAMSAAIAGAAIGISYMKYSDRKYHEQQQQQQHLKYHIPKSQQQSLVFTTNPPDESERDGIGSKLLFPHNHEEKMRRKISARALVEEDNFHPRDSVTVRVPATSANMGPGCMF